MNKIEINVSNKSWWLSLGDSVITFSLIFNLYFMIVFQQACYSIIKIVPKCSFHFVNVVSQCCDSMLWVGKPQEKLFFNVSPHINIVNWS